MVMDDSLYESPFSKALLTGVFAGLITTLVLLVFNILFREETGFLPSDLINVSSLIFIVNLIFLVMGVAYALLLRSRKGDLIYIIIFALLTLITVLQTIHINRSDVAVENTQFRQLLTTIVVVIGVVGTFGIPVMFRNKKFREHVI